MYAHINNIIFKNFKYADIQRISKKEDHLIVQIFLTIFD